MQKTDNTQKAAGYIERVFRGETSNGKPRFGLLIGEDWYNGFGETDLEDGQFVKLAFTDNEYGHNIKGKAEPSEQPKPGFKSFPPEDPGYKKPEPKRQSQAGSDSELSNAATHRMIATFEALTAKRKLSDWESAQLQCWVWQTIYNNLMLDRRTKWIDESKNNRIQRRFTR